jgi:hypothetical protein
VAEYVRWKIHKQVALEATAAFSTLTDDEDFHDRTRMKNRDQT